MTTNVLGPLRPTSVTVVAVLLWVNAVLDIVGGIVFLAAADEAEGVSASSRTLVLTVGFAIIVVGVIAAILAFGLLRGNSAARIGVTIVEAVSLALSIIAMISTPSTIGSELVSALIAAVILAILWSGASSRFFRGIGPDQPVVD